jgi:hypothetical protein
LVAASVAVDILEASPIEDWGEFFHNLFGPISDGEVLTPRAYVLDQNVFVGLFYDFVVGFASAHAISSLETK